MFFRWLLIQSIVFLLISPLTLDLIYDTNLIHNYVISIVFIVSLVVGTQLNKPRLIYTHESSYYQPKINKKWLIFWLLIVLSIVIQENLYLTRIGSEAAAYNRSEMNVITLVLYRGFILIAPIIVSLMILEIFNKETLKSTIIINVFMIVAIVFCMGGFDSRAIVILLLIYAVLFTNKIINKTIWKSLFIYTLLIGSIFFFAIMMVRVVNDDNQSFNKYLSSEIFQRTDGLEFISKYQMLNNVGYFDMHIDGIGNALKAQLFFLDEAKELKAQGLTSIKTHILKNELDLNNLDVNYSIIADSFYMFGIMGVLFSGLYFGLSIKKIDNNGFLNMDGKLNICHIALSISIFSIETDLLSLITTYTKIFIILNILVYIGFIQYKRINE